MADKKVPTIRPAAQARLLLYRLFGGVLNEAEVRVLRQPLEYWERLMTQLEGEPQAKSVEPTLKNVFHHIEKSTRRDLERQFQTILGRPLWLGVFPRGLLEDFIKEHLILLKDLRREQLSRIATTLQRGIRQGWLQKNLEKEIRNQTGLCKKRARLIARNAPLQYSGAITRHHQTQAGIKKYRWQTSKDKRVRDSHSAKDGKVFNWDTPGPHPRGEVNCRCDAVPILLINGRHFTGT